MKFNFKKTLIEPFENKKINVPSVKNIMLLKQANTYETYLKLEKDQCDSLAKNVIKIVIPAMVAIGSMGVSAHEYVKTLQVHSKFYNDAIRLINEAAVEDVLNK